MSFDHIDRMPTRHSNTTVSRPPSHRSRSARSTRSSRSRRAPPRRTRKQAPLDNAFWERATELIREEGLRWQLLADEMPGTGDSLRYRATALLRAAGILAEKRSSLRSFADADALPGIGSGVLDRLQAIARDETPVPLLEARSRMEKEGLQLSEAGSDSLDLVHGLGPKRRSQLMALGVRTIPQLMAYVLEHPEALSRAGHVALRHAADLLEHIPREESDQFAARVAALFGPIPVELVGSYRRQRPTSRDWDLLVTSDKLRPQEVVARLRRTFQLETLSVGTRKWEGLILGPAKKWRRLDIRLVSPTSYGAHLLYFTGSKEHNIWMRKRAQQMGLRLNEYGLFRLSDGGLVSATTEEDLFRALGLAWVPPEKREISLR